MSAPPEAIPERSLATLAVKTEFFERTRMFHGRSDISLSEGLAGAGGLTFGAVDVTTTVRNYSLEDVVLDADSLILFKNGRPIPQTAYFEPPDAVRSLASDTELNALPDEEDFILGYNNAHLGYQHWVTQCLPAIDWSLRQSRRRPVRLLLPHLEGWQEDFLVLLGYGRIPRLTIRGAAKYRLSYVEYSDFLNGSTSFGVCLSALDTLGRIARAVPAFPSADRVLYVDEVRPYYGSIRNRDSLFELLRRHGVTIVERARRGTAQRINLFRNADAVIGPLGEGLTDVVFCRPGALLWEWMPRHQQNASFNRLAQAAGVDYWGDLFESTHDPREPGEWEVDLSLVSRRLSELFDRLGHVVKPICLERVSAAIGIPPRPPLDELLLRFESLGDNCEFGLVQRRAGVEPLGLLRFNGFYVPPEFRLERLVAALDRQFAGLGAPGTVTVFADGVSGERELIACESGYEFRYHTGIEEGKVELETQAGLETIRLGFLRRKLLEDLGTGQKTWVWKSEGTSSRDQIQPLLDVLRRFGPNTLLWLVEADLDHAAGVVEAVEPDLLKGYIERFAPYGAVAGIHFASWFEVCWRANEIRDGATPRGIRCE